MYEQFGGLVDQAAKTVTFKLFVPDGERDPSQYEGGGLPRLTDVFVVGSFQPTPWDTAAPIAMTRADYSESPGAPVKGWLYSHTTDPLSDGFYEYKYLLHFENADPIMITDPCSRYGGSENQNSGFVVGGAIEAVNPIANRLPYSDLMLYELMIDDFTANIKKDDEAPLQTIVRKLDDLAALGINAIEFMPWTAWIYPDSPKSDFSWGYNPVQYFSVAHKYTLNPTTDTDKLVYLKRLINECHARKIHVIMDGVFNHADAIPPDRGFPYYWLYQDPADSPYVGNFEQADFFKDLDYANQCTLEYIRDACFYWIDQFKIDGIRFDNTLGFYRPGDRGHGLPKLLSELRGHFSKNKTKNFSTILEHSWDYAAIDVVNKVGSTSCWLDPYRSQSMDYLGSRQIEPGIMRMLDSGRDYAVDHVPTIYIENHDHKRFMLKAGGRGSWYLTQPYIIALFTSPGATLIYNGQEYGAQNDMPEQGDGRVVPRPLDWAWLQNDEGPTVLARYQAMMALRKQHPALRTTNFYPSKWDESQTQMNSNGYGIDRARNLVVYHRWGDAADGKTDRYYVALNFSSADQAVSFAAPDGSWNELINGGVVNAANGSISVTVKSNWGAIYYQSA